MKLDRDKYLSADAEGRGTILCKSYGLPSGMMWKHKQSGKWIISHAAVQSIASQEGILVEYIPVSLLPDFVVVSAHPYTAADSLKVYGQSTFGEASPKNNKMGYPVAMAEKRGFDRAVLIYVLASVGGYGADFYGEDEADDFKASKPEEPAKKAKPKGQPAGSAEAALRAVGDAKTAGDVHALYAANKSSATDEGWQKDLWDACVERGEALSGGG